MPDWIVFVSTFSNIIIFAAYLAIPALMLYHREQFKKALPMGIVVLFSAFILACGIEHGVEATMFYFPRYRLTTLLLFVTAVISALAAVSFAMVAPGLIGRLVLTRDEKLINGLEQLRKLSAGINCHPFGTAIYDMDMRLVSCSRSWVGFFGLPGFRKIEGKTHYEIFPTLKETNPEWTEFHQRALRGESLRSDDVIEYHGKKFRWYIGPLKSVIHDELVIIGMYMCVENVPSESDKWTAINE